MLAKRFLLAVILFFMICLALAETNQTTKVIINPPNMKGMKMSAQSQNISNIKINKFEYGNLYYGDLSQDEINNLVSQGYIVQQDKVFHILLQNSVPLIKANYSWDLQISEENLTGQGQTVCIIDTGVNYSHPDLGNCTQSEFLAGNCSKVIGGWDFVNNNNNPMDDNGHGTHVSGIVAADGSIKGVAPDAKIVALKVLDSGGSGYSSNIIKGIGWCVSNSSKFNISIISMSLGDGENYTSYCDNDNLNNQAFAVAINNAAAKNISVVVAAGNSGNYTAISSPACITNATAVTSSTKTDAISSFSNRNPIVSLIAPGGTSTGAGSCTSSVTDANRICSTSISGNYIAYSGTSMAAPHVSGAIAILKQELVLTSQTKTNKEIESILNLTGKLIYDSSSNRNYSRINLLNATLYLDNISPNITLISPLNNSISLTQNQTFSCNFTDWQLENMTFYLWNSTGLVYNETRNVSGTGNLSEFNVSNLNYNNYVWACKVYDKKNNFAFSYNFSFANKNNPVFGVLHSIHTTISDETETQAQRVSDLMSNYDWAAIIEHDSQINEAEWNLMKNESNGNNTDNNFTYFLGYEWKGTSSNNIEVSAFFLDNGSILASGNNESYDTLQEFLDWMSLNNGIGCINHPARTGNVWNFSDLTSKNKTILPCIEILNKDDYYWNNYWNCSLTSGCESYGNPSPPSSVNWNSSVKTALDNGFYLGFVGGWDYHGTYPGIPTAYTGLASVDNWTRQGIFNSIQERHTWAAEDKILFELNVNNGSQNFIMGDIFNTSVSEIYLNYSVNATYENKIVNMSLFLDGVIVNFTTFSNGNISSSFKLTFSDSQEHYVFLEATQNNSKRAWTSPVYITYVPVEEVSEPEILPSSSSGGGGGGKTTNTETYVLSIEQSNSGYTKELNQDDKIKFTIFDEKSEIHTITLDKIGDNFVELTVASNPINVKLGIGQSIKLNLTSSDYYNLYIKLESILNGKAKITMQTINEVIIKSKDESVVNSQDNQNNKTIQQEKRDYFWYLVSASVFIVFIVALTIHLFESREREKEIKEVKKKLNKENK